MNDNLKNYATSPDPQVWEKIEKTMRRRALRRQVMTGTAGAAIVALAIVGVIFWPNDNANVAQRTLPDVAQVMPREVAPLETEGQKADVSELSVEKAKEVAPRVDKTVEAQSVVSSSAQKVEPSTQIAYPTVVSQVIPQSVTPISPKVEDPVSAQVVNETMAQAEPIAEAKTSATPSDKAPISSAGEDTILWIPNVFVPVSDDAEINTFRARLNHPGDVLTNYRLSIFNRSGNLVFMSNDINEAWDGTYRGREMPQAAYIYVIYYTDRDGFRHQRKGTITLVR